MAAQDAVVGDCGSSWSPGTFGTCGRERKPPSVGLGLFLDVLFDELVVGET